MNELSSTVEDRIIADPIGSYADFHSRLMKDGPNAPFPEFGPIVEFLAKELESEHFQKLLTDNPALRFELTETRTFLAHVNLSFKVDDVERYPYEIPFDQPFPYRPTLDAIEAAIRLLDKLNRLEPGNRAVQLYHFDRYCYHRHALVANPDIVLIPTVKELSLADFIRTRSVPVEFVGVVSRTTRVDGHQQSPLDFWYHDLNHARRLYAYIHRRLKQQGIGADEGKAVFYRTVDAFITGTIFPKIIRTTPDLSEEERALHNIATMIIFEIVHETALTLEKDEILKDLFRGNGPQPFEYMVAEEYRGEHDVEKLRTPTGNLQSGTSSMSRPGEEEIRIRYFLDASSVGLLANVFHKLTHHYYDDEGAVNEELVPSKYRTPEYLVKAAKLICEAVGAIDVPSDEELLNLVVDREGTKERILTKGIYGEDSTQSATEPIFADEVISQVKTLGKKVYTLFGYSALEYEDKDAVFARIKTDIEKLNPDEWFINIGATEEGIGGAYKIAKDLGFKTIGIVSTQALSYSGNFSPYVDMIYIVNDANWGGYLPGTDKLTEATKAYLGTSDVIAAYGGGENTAVTLREAKKLGTPLSYVPADMNHEKALKQSHGKPVDFKGAAFAAWEELQSA
ncbi:MAG: hypothetical protein Q8P36_01435 [bacterium]|nr:hypothetical protein [bacterium]